MKGPEVLRSEWLAPMADGFSLAGRTLVPEAVAFAFYGALFRGTEQTRSTSGTEAFARGDESDAEFDTELLSQLWSAAALADHDASVSCRLQCCAKKNTFFCIATWFRTFLK